MFSLGAEQSQSGAANSANHLGVHPAKLREGAERLRKQAEENPDELDLFKAMASMCERPTEANYLKLVEIVHSREVRTCIFTSNPYGQDFVWVADYGNAGAWVVDGHAEWSNYRVSRRTRQRSQIYSGDTQQGRRAQTLLGRQCSD